MDSDIKPQPVVVETICDLCGLRWEDHGEDPTALDCIRLLKAKPSIVINPTPFVPAQPFQPYAPPSWGPITSITPAPPTARIWCAADAGDGSWPGMARTVVGDGVTINGFVTTMEAVEAFSSGSTPTALVAAA